MIKKVTREEAEKIWPAKCPVKPVGERLVVQRLDPTKEYAPGIVIPEAYREKNQKMRVLAVGPGRMMPDGKIIPPTCGNPGQPIKVGDVVLVNSYNSQEELEIDGVELCIIHSEGVLGVVK